MAQPNQGRGTVSSETCSSLVISGRIPLSLLSRTPAPGPRGAWGRFPGGACAGGAGHLLAVYPCAAEPAIVFGCVLSDGKQVPAIPDRFSKSPGLRATGTARLQLCS